MTMMAAMLAAVMAASGPIGDDANAVKTPAPTTPERGELVTDRPDFTESSLVVGKGIWQLETGAIYATQFHPEKSQDDGIRVLENFAAIVREAR